MADYSKLQLDELIEEHKRLISVLQSESHEDDKREAKTQVKELEGYIKQRKELEKAIDRSRLTKKVVTDKRGHQKTVWVKTDQQAGSNKDAQADQFTKKYMEGLADLKKEVSKDNSPLNTSGTAKLYYQNAMKMGVDNKIIDNKTRLKLNRHNKEFGSLSGRTQKELIIEGIDIALNSIKNS